MLFRPQFSPQKIEKPLFGVQIFKNFCETFPPPPPPSQGLTCPFDIVGYPIQSCWLLQFLLKPLHQVSIFPYAQVRFLQNISTNCLVTCLVDT